MRTFMMACIQRIPKRPFTDLSYLMLVVVEVMLNVQLNNICVTSFKINLFEGFLFAGWLVTRRPGQLIEVLMSDFTYHSHTPFTKSRKKGHTQISKHLLAILIISCS